MFSILNSGSSCEEDACSARIPAFDIQQQNLYLNLRQTNSSSNICDITDYNKSGQVSVKKTDENCGNLTNSLKSYSDVDISNNPVCIQSVPSSVNITHHFKKINISPKNLLKLYLKPLCIYEHLNTWNGKLDDEMLQSDLVLTEPKKFHIILTKLYKQLDTECGIISDTPTEFDSIHVPSISISDYYLRLQQFLNCSFLCHVVAIIYLDKLINTKEFRIDNRNIHRLLVLSTTLAAKLYDDLYMSNEYYARVAGINTCEFSTLESSLIALLNYKIFVPLSEIAQYFNAIASADCSTL